jgi:hypothetical protein
VCNEGFLIARQVLLNVFLDCLQLGFEILGTLINCYSSPLLSPLGLIMLTYWDTVFFFGWRHLAARVVARAGFFAVVRLSLTLVFGRRAAT